VEYYYLKLHGSATFTITVEDTTPPITTIDSVIDGYFQPLVDGDPTGSDSIEFEFSGIDIVSFPITLSFECNLDSGGFTACTSPFYINGLVDQIHFIEIRATDEAGNVESTASFTWTVDSTIFCDGMTIPELISSGNYHIFDNREGPSTFLRGTIDPDLMLAGSFGDELWGVTGDDCIIGGEGDDLLKGHSGSDQIFG